MLGLNTKVTALILINILVVYGNIYQKARYLMYSDHVEYIHKLYLNDTDSQYNFVIPQPKLEHSRGDNLDIQRGWPNLIPVDKEDNNEFEQGKNMLDSIPNIENNNEPKSNGLPESQENESELDQEKKKPNWFHRNIHDKESKPYRLPESLEDHNKLDQEKNKPTWFSSSINDDETKSRLNFLQRIWDNNHKNRISESSNNYPTKRKPGHAGLKKKCHKIKGLPNPDSGCCGVQLPGYRSKKYPNSPPWLKHRGRFTRSADSDTPPSKMIKGGKATDLHQLPWMVRLFIDTVDTEVDNPEECGGTIISSRYILTAAHCLFDKVKLRKRLTVILAEYNTYYFPRDCIGTRCIKNQVKQIQHVILHPEFNHTYLQNDVALIRLSSDIRYTDYIRPICLPTSDIADMSDKPLIIAGWGLNGRTESNLKQSAVIHYVSDVKCKEQYSYKDDSMFCSIGGNGEDICHGDSGGPLMVQSRGKYYLLGVISGKRGDKECGLSLSSLFSNVFYHLKWIKSNVH